ncbi:hypothetical protein M422DRAFT_40848 [Sphaerobolus stellatus SS14]|nr:hypothetical protein M422DRAFT_40848 [Sphaerobolus stellatus SS14]
MFWATLIFCHTRTCQILSYLSLVFNIIGALAIDGIQICRVYAVSGGNKRLFIALSSVFGISVMLGGVGHVILQHLEVTDSSSYSLCMHPTPMSHPHRRNVLLIAQCGMALFGEIIVIVVTLKSSWTAFRQNITSPITWSEGASLAELFLRQGIIRFLHSNHCHVRESYYTFLLILLSSHSQVLGAYRGSFGISLQNA